MEGIIRENISFKRGINSRESLNVGEFREREYPTFEEFMSMEDGIYLVKKKDDTYGDMTSIIQKYKDSHKKSIYKISDYWKNSIDGSIKDFLNDKWWWTEDASKIKQMIFDQNEILYIKKINLEDAS